MHVMMTKEQFDMLKKKAGGGNGKDKDKEDSKAQGAEGKKADSSKDKSKEGQSVKLKEDDDVHGTIETDDFIVGYFYNASEARLNIGPVSKRKTLAAYVAGDNIIGTYVMDMFAAMPNPKSNGKDKDKDKSEGEEGEAQEKKDQNQHQSQPSQ